jgi:hypothetical protein
VTPQAILERAEQLGLVLVAEPDDRLRVRGAEEARRALIPLLREHKAAILRKLLQREHRLVGIAPTPQDAVREAARLLRGRRWAREPAPCGFHIGPPGKTCCRCGGAWTEHYPASAVEPAT